MQILAYQKFERMHIDSVSITPRGSLLTVMMLMNERINSSHVKDTMKPHVEEDIKQVKPNKRPQSVRERHFLRAPLNRRSIVCYINCVIYKNHCQNFVYVDERLVQSRQFIQVLATH